MKYKNAYKGLILFTFFFSLFLPQATVKAAAGITLDGSFGDWAGKPCVSDPNGDASSTLDLVAFCFIADLDTQEVYFMFERSSGSNSPTDYVIRMDVNNDGDYSDPEDRLISIRYNLSKKKSMVDVDIYDGTWNYITTKASKANWGATGDDGAAQVELFASFADLGINPGVATAVTMDIYSGNFDDVLDTPVTWTPADALGYMLLGGIILGASIFMVFQRKKKFVLPSFRGTQKDSGAK